MSNIYEKAREVEANWKEYNLPTHYLEKFIFNYLINKSVGEYDLRSIFSTDVIELLLKSGEQIINAKAQGEVLVTVGSDGVKEIDFSSVDYEKIFSVWESAGWISTTVLADNQTKVQLI